MRAAGAPAGVVPLDPASPWPKFRANALQTGRSRVEPVVDPTRRPWSFQTGKGVFSSPVIDSSALLDDRGRVYFGSGDADVYALERDSGKLVWRFEADSVEAVE